MAIDYRVLGRLEVVRDGTPLELGAFRQRALLALLLSHAGTVLSTDRILDELWAETGGTDKHGSLWVYVSGLRAVLEPGRAKRSEGTILLTRPPGYVLEIDRDDTDAGRFERSVVEGRMLADSDPAAASLVLRAALATWRGHAYEEFAYESWAQTEISRLEELRLEAIENRIDADGRVGLSRELVSELQGLVRQHPLRERFVTSLMLALYRCGRAAEALRTSAAYRQRLVADVGVEPSLALRDLEHDILTDDGSLLVQRASESGPLHPRSGLTVRGYELRDELGRGASATVFRAYQPIVGREVAIKVITPGVADDPAFIRRFEAEAQLVAGLEHPHIVPLYDYWREPGAAYLVMRLIDAGSLADLLAGGALPAEHASSVVAQIASALRSAHRQGVVHGDVRPQNILIDRDGFAYLTDFGVAAGADAYATSTSPTTLSPESDQYSLAVTAAAALTALGGEYEQLRGALPPAARVVLDRATADDPARRYADVAAFGQALSDALGVTSSPLLDDTEIDNPYKGLRPFGPADAGEFFGRDRLVQRLVARLGAPGIRGRFVAVVGPSGSGKSSVVRAGLLPALARGALPMSADWLRIDMTPAPHPFEELGAALLRIASDPPTTLLDLVLTPGGVRKAIERVLPTEHDQLLLVIDQFEELFTQVDDDTATRFIDELAEVVTAPATRVRIVITLRADFYDRPLRHRQLGELLREGTEVITPMSVDELEAAITGPAGRAGVDVHPLVVSEMVSETVDRVGALPLLQYTLTELFEARVGRTIGLTAYRAGGGVTRTLARRADSLLAGLGRGMAGTARQVFLRLVTVDDDTNTATRRRALVVELDDLDLPGRVRRLLDTFGRHRLLTFDRDPVTRGPTAEISHETLITEWATLRTWIDDARGDLRMHRQLVAEMKAWTTADASEDYLLRGGRLDIIDAWAATTTIGLRAAERQFLDASLEARADEQRGERGDGAQDDGGGAPSAATHPPTRRRRRDDRRRRGLGHVRLDAASGCSPGRGRPDRQPGRTDARRPGGELPVQRSRAGVAPGEGSGRRDGRPRLRAP